MRKGMSMDAKSIRVVGQYLAKQARMLARACAEEDRAAALAFAEALARRPESIIKKG
jgi:hypothetical protein